MARVFLYSGREWKSAIPSFLWQKKTPALQERVLKKALKLNHTITGFIFPN